jgi:hypothetical protein
MAILLLTNYRRLRPLLLIVNRSLDGIDEAAEKRFYKPGKAPLAGQNRGGKLAKKDFLTCGSDTSACP